MILYEMITRTVPFNGLDSLQIIYAVGIQHQHPSIPDSVRDQHRALVTLMEDCWNADPELRPSFLEIQLALIRIQKALNKAKQ